MPRRVSPHTSSRRSDTPADSVDDDRVADVPGAPYWVRHWVRNPGFEQYTPVMPDQRSGSFAATSCDSKSHQGGLVMKGSAVRVRASALVLGRDLPVLGRLRFSLVGALCMACRRALDARPVRPAHAPDGAGLAVSTVSLAALDGHGAPSPRSQ